MRVLLIGSGGREHAMARALVEDKSVELYCAPGNVGTAAHGRNVAVNVDDLDGLAQLVFRERIELCIPGPEAPLCAGLVDHLRNLPVVKSCGPSAAAARLESSKAFMRQLTEPLGVPGPRWRVARNRRELLA